ncbi:SusE domain-containing protein [Sungkyunkwania multivorans]|uniref:SusE domain-containing protein n=1 Tax=Sungkyunkwania multivorans TaxID=1173618 RepID=A0ABW3D1S7_9FLAO
MKYLFKNISLFLVALTMLYSCGEDDSIEVLAPEAAFELQQPGITNINLNFALPDNPAFTISWDDDLSGASTYTAEMSMDIEFTAPISLGTSDSKTFTMTVSELNAALNNAGIEAFVEMPIYVRVTGGNLTTNVVRFDVTAYPEMPPVFTSVDATTSYVLSDVAPDNEVALIEWDDLDFTNLTADVNVDYTVEVAEVGTDFAAAFILGTVNNTTSLSVTHATMNEAALASGGVAEEAGQVEIRVSAIVNTAASSFERVSDIVTISVTPYNTVLAPILYGVGAGLPDAGWGWGSPVELTLQGNVYSGNVNLSPDNGGNFRFFTIRDDWNSGQNFPWYTDRGFTIDANFANANDGDQNFLFTGTAGEYFLEIDMANKTITLGPAVVGPNCALDQLWLVGAGVPDAGWGWGSPVQLPCVGTGVYAGNVTFANDAFRFFTTEGDWNSGQNYPFYSNDGYTIDANFENAADGDSNFRFIGTPGEFYLEVDTVNKTITLGAAQSQCALDQLWLVGAGVPDAGWGWGSPVQLPCTGVGTYSGSVTFANDAFRFFTVEGDWNSGQNYPFYIGEGYTIDANFENAADGDSNFRFIGTPGTYNLTVDTVNKTITLN